MQYVFFLKDSKRNENHRQYLVRQPFFCDLGGALPFWNRPSARQPVEFFLFNSFFLKDSKCDEKHRQCLVGQPFCCDVDGAWPSWNRPSAGQPVEFVFFSFFLEGAQARRKALTVSGWVAIFLRFKWGFAVLEPAVGRPACGVLLLFFFFLEGVQARQKAPTVSGWAAIFLRFRWGLAVLEPAVGRPAG